MKKGKKKFIFWAVAALGDGISGSDRIFIELARRWSKEHKITIYVWEEGLAMAKRQRLKGSKNLQIKVFKLKNWCRLGFFVCYIARIVKSCIVAINLRIDDQKSVVFYNASEFWMDSLPCLILKLRYPKSTWAASWYQTAPNPFKGFTEGDRASKYRLSAILYWLMQLPVKPLISKFADKVIVNNELEKKRFPKHTARGDTIVLIGAVPLPDIKKYLNNKQRTKSKKQFDAVFQGRFHPQKGVVELIDIWRKVVDKKPNAKLAMIGDGPLMNEVKTRIAYHELRNNVKLFGYVYDGYKKYSIFHASKVVVHPAFYDSGGMASAEAMAFGLPAVGFDLKAYQSYYPRGMVKVKTGDLRAFASKILELIEDGEKRLRLGREAKQMIEKNWSWDIRAEDIKRKILK